MTSASIACLGITVMLGGAGVFRTSAVTDASGQASQTFGQRLVLRDGWLLKSSVLVPEGGAAVSASNYMPAKWLPVSVPSTVLSGLIKNGVYPDPRVALNAYRIPDASDEFNAKHHLAQFSYLPDRRNPWRNPYWFRKKFTLPKLPPDRRVWLHFDAVNYRAEVWLNGSRVADPATAAGMFQRFQFDITEIAQPGDNVLAVRIFPVDHPGTPDAMLEPLGKERGYLGKEIMRDVTQVMTVGYDCLMPVPDRNMGLWQPVWIDWTGPVDLRNPFVVTDLPLPETNRAVLTISAELANTAAVPVRAILRGSVMGTDVHFAQAVELGPKETQAVSVDPKPVMRNPRLWWPVNYGEQHRYELKLTLEAQGSRTPSDEERIAFGVREVGCAMHEINGWHGRRVLVNGQKIFCRGRYLQPELLFDWDARRMETEIRYYAQANLNLICFEDIPNPPEPFLELCDRYGILFGHCAYSCYWLRLGMSYPDDAALLERCTVDMVKRYRNHPSLLFYMAMNEGDTREDIYAMWRRHIQALDGTRWFIPSASFPSDRRNVSDWFKPDLPAGMTDRGASYSWAEPAQYFRWVREARHWMFMMEGGFASLPPISSLDKFLTNATARSTGDRRFPLDTVWAHHGANHYYKGYDQALRRLHGEPENVTDYCWKGHLVTADQHRSFFEAVNHRLWDITSGATQWKINTGEPTVQWQIFDYYLKPMVSWFCIKRACEPLHVQLNLADQTVAVINLHPQSQPDLEVRARVFDLNAKLLWEKTAGARVPASAFQDCFTVPEPPDATAVYFVKLELHDASGRRLSNNFYWLRAQGVDDLRALQTLPLVKLTSSFRIETRGAEKVARVRITNPTDKLAFFVQLALTRGTGGAEILPVFWDDNYFSLLPGESREITATLSVADAAGARPTLEVGGWNVESDFTCALLEVSSNPIKAGQPFTVTARIANTFLDGARMALRVDGKPVATQWAWAREHRQQTLTFPLTLDPPGPHRLQIGNKSLPVTAW